MRRKNANYSTTKFLILGMLEIALQLAFVRIHNVAFVHRSFQYIGVFFWKVCLY
jgi:hypothetical protein